jgi:hypothetical protein
MEHSRFSTLLFGILSEPKKQLTHAGFDLAFIVASRRGQYEHDDH